jgi:integrase
MTNTALTTIAENKSIDLAISGWLASHGKRIDENAQVTHTRTSKAYETTIQQFRAGLRRMNKDLDTDVQTIILLAQAFAAGTVNEKKTAVQQSTYNLRLAILCSFYDYAMGRYLIMPMDDAGHVLNPIKVVKREKVQAYKGVHALEPEEAMHRLQQIDRATPLGKRDYALLAILLQTGRRLSEVTTLRWRHVQL